MSSEKLTVEPVVPVGVVDAPPAWVGVVLVSPGPASVGVGVTDVFTGTWAGLNARKANNKINNKSRKASAISIHFFEAGFAGSVSVTASGVAGTVSGSGATTDSSLTGLTTSEFFSVI